MRAPGSSTWAALALLACCLQLAAAGDGSNSTQPYSCDALARVPLGERCSFVLEHCPSEGLIPYSEWYHCHVAKHNSFICFWYLALVACLLPLFFCLLGDTAEFYFSPIMSLVSQSIPKMRPRFAGVTFVALGNGAPDLSANITAIRNGEVLLSAGALTGGAMFVQCIVAAELVSMGKGAKCGGAMMRDVGVYSISIFSVLIAFALGRVTQLFVGWAITVYVLYVVWVFCGDEWHERGRPQPNVGEWQQTLRSIRDGLTFRRRSGGCLVDEMEESLLPWASAEEGNGAAATQQRRSGSLGHTELPMMDLPGSTDLGQDEDGWHANGHAAADSEVMEQGRQPQHLAQHHQMPQQRASSAPLATQKRLPRRSSSGGAGAHPYVDAKTYKKLVWADLSNDAEEEARLEEEAAQAAEELQRRSLTGASAGPSSAPSPYEPPRPIHTYEELPALSERSGASGASPSYSGSPGRGWRGHRSPSPFAGGGAEGLGRGGGGSGFREGLGGGVDAWPPDWRALWLQLRHELTLGNSEEWDEAGGVIRMFRQIAFPVLLPLYLALRTTIPFADPGTYSRPWLATSLLCCPLAMVAYFGAASVTAVLVAMGAGLAAAGTVWFLTRADPEHVPMMECGTGVPLGPGLLSLLGFVMGVMWIDTIAGEVVGVLSFLAGLLNFPTGILGLTLLAWGNSLGDFFSNRAMARNGQASTAITACFAAPLFNMLMSLSLGFSSLFHKSGVRSIAVTLTPEVLLGCLFLMAYNAAIVAVGRLNGGRLPAWFAVFARCWYGLYAVLACLSGVLQHYGYGLFGSWGT